MHFNFAFTAVQILWTFTFAALLVLLVVLLGRDRVHRFPWFTASIVLVALRLLSTRLLNDRMAQFTTASIFIVLADFSALVGLLVVHEMARKAFARVQRETWISWALLLLSLGVVVLTYWGTWPSWKALAFDTPMAQLSVMQLLSQKTNLLVDVLTVSLGVLVVLFGRRYGAGPHSHVQRIVIGLSTASLAQMAAEGIWEIVAHATTPHSEAEYLQAMALRDKLFNANSVVYIAVVVWWIGCLWMDEPHIEQESFDSPTIDDNDELETTEEEPREDAQVDAEWLKRPED
jgi:hypothetical protein